MLVRIIHNVVQMWNSILANQGLCIVYLFIVLFLAMPLTVVVYFSVAVFDMLTGKETDPLMVQRSIINALLITIGILYIPVLNGFVHDAIRETGSVVIGLATVIVVHIVIIPMAVIHSELIDNAHKNIFDKFRKH